MYIFAIYIMYMTKEYPHFTGFDWDSGNRDKNLKHNVQNWECEQVFFNDPLIVLEDPRHSIAENRFAAFGKTDSGRQLVVVYTVRGSRVRVVSARDMNKRERRFYEEAGQE
jgi:uncharacterized DUF497 family protein